MPYLNPGGFNFGPANWDGFGISQIVFAVVYTAGLYAACIYLWIQRHHPVVRMRKVGLMLLSILVVHVFLFMVLTVYAMNGAWPCSVEFWSMNLYLPIGIGLWQAQNQQLLLVSRQQTQFISSNDTYKPLLPASGRGFGTFRYWIWRLKLWYQNTSHQGKYEGFVLIGIAIQFLVSFVVYNISRKFNHYGIVSHHTSPGLCRRGWEWLPSIIWQFLWTWVFGPYILWKIRMIRDIYHWRLQTIITVVAGLPGTPLWLAAVYADKFGPVNKYWIPAMWFVPGIMAMQICTLGFPISQILKHKRGARETNRVLAEFDKKRLDSSVDSITVQGSTTSVSLKSKQRGKMYSMESLDECLAGNHDSLQVYASVVELNGENIVFLGKVFDFRQAWHKAFHNTSRSADEIRRARDEMFRHALNIFITLIHSSTASFPINIESPIYSRLNTIFGSATALAAKSDGSSRASSLSTTSTVTPWDEPQTLSPVTSPTEEFSSFPMRTLMKSQSDFSVGGHSSSSEHATSFKEPEMEGDGILKDDHDPLEGFPVPEEFNVNVFDAAYQSIRYMVWSETWQRYMVWKQKGSHESIGRAI